MTPGQRDFLALFASEGVRYLTIGGYGMRCHGFDRTTFDLDLWVDRSAQNAERIERVIEQLAPGHAPNGRKWRDVFQLEACLVEHPSIGPEKQVDILTGVGGMDFDACYVRSTVANVDGVSLRVLCIEDLLKSKVLALQLGTHMLGRLRDQADHDHLLARLRTARNP